MNTDSIIAYALAKSQSGGGGDIENTWKETDFSSIALESGVPAAAGSLTLDAGIWLVSWEAHFSANSSGTRACCLSDTPVTSMAACIANGTVTGVSGVQTVLCGSRLVKLEEGKELSLYVCHSSGGSVRLMNGSLSAICFSN